FRRCRRCASDTRPEVAPWPMECLREKLVNAFALSFGVRGELVNRASAQTACQPASLPGVLLTCNCRRLARVFPNGGQLSDHNVKLRRIDLLFLRLLASHDARAYGVLDRGVDRDRAASA